MYKRKFTKWESIAVCIRAYCDIDTEEFVFNVGVDEYGCIRLEMMIKLLW